jgi:multidrug resistance efflux pump
VQNTNTFYAVELWNKRSADSEITSLMARVAEIEAASDMKSNLCMEWKVAKNKAQARVSKLELEEEGAKEAFAVVADSNKLLRAQVSKMESALNLMRHELGRTRLGAADKAGGGDAAY